MRYHRFENIVWSYYRTHKRTLPWRNTRDPYRILVSEVMLQQTQVRRVLEKYPEFLKAFPTFKALARAPLSRVLRAWQGMGYNRRVLHLKRLAEMVVHEYGSIPPKDPALLRKLPGIGGSTAGAICAFAFNMAIPFLETNIRRAYLHHFFPKKRKVSDEEILGLVEKTLDRENPREWYWALMDYGAMLGARGENPNRRSARYRRQSPFRGSNRELRGKVVKLLVLQKALSPQEFRQLLPEYAPHIRNVLQKLKQEGFIKQHKEKITLKA